jgi:hypothetical protein
MYIDGRFVEPAGGQFFESDNPYTGSRGHSFRAAMPRTSTAPCARRTGR